MEKPVKNPKAFDPVSEWLRKSDEFARREPTKAAVSAFGAGFILNLLPIGAIVGALVSVLFVMARPVLLFLGVMKACDLCRTNKSSHA
jgi:hypothetical protein